MPRRNTFHYLFVLIILATASLACRAADIYSDMTVDLMESLFPDLMYGSTTEQDAAINPDSDSPQDVSLQPDVAPQKILRIHKILNAGISINVMPWVR